MESMQNNKKSFKTIIHIFFTTLFKGLKNTLKTSWFLIKIIIPVTFVVKLLQHLDLLKHLVFLFEPIMRLVGLPGDAALVILTSNFINIYAGLTVLSNFSFSAKEITILAMMILFSHSMLLETAVIKGLGIPKYKQVILRVGSSLFAGFALNLLIGSRMAETVVGVAAESSHYEPFSVQSWTLFFSWASNFGIDFLLSSFNSLKTMILLIAYVLVGIEFLKVTKILDRLNHILFLGTRHLGISEKATTPLFVGIFVGIVYGAGAILLSHKEGEMSKRDVILVSSFLCLCHALIEDTLLFGKMGANLWIILFGRLGYSILFVFMLNRILLHNQNKRVPIQTKIDAS